MQRLNKYLLVIGSTGMILLVWTLGCGRAESHAIARTQKDMKNAALALEIYVRETQSLPSAPDADGRIEMEPQRLYRMLYGAEAARYRIGQAPSHWQKAEKLVDRWGNSLNFEMVREKTQSGTNGGMRYKVTIWSNGPNGRNEGGSRDDITSEPFTVVPELLP
jgi:hypothetical protein